ncbi:MULTISPECIES: ABC transporter ATP-binding protein [unclassified Microbacterium]|uniref:ABC transporter ATP-binding protein n=1 Tax=unclassified Microbacterium TaxID=2609290 RepID=UPI000EA8C8D5|nr:MULTISPECIES: ATP-binding cassette domain-containing protein [unclassified Microbacterium]MBT2484692.1 ATP-binding cassette domain-containing protein [Microbacterium sp. ISL-108]RKN67577.1 ATP-binding cassette domain-containing protein [Microbacterium sp. CGR2]
MNISASLPLEARGLRKAFKGHSRIDDVSFAIRPGRIVGLLGPNGAGKTTTIRLLLGLAASDAGEPLVFGRRYRDIERPARSVGAVLDGGGLHPARTGRQHLRIAAARSHMAAERVDVVLAEVGMTRDADRRAGGYSLGMKQRIAIAAALLGEPQVLVLDEPSNGLDPAGMRWLRDRLRAFAHDGGTVLLSSHLLSDVQDIADDIVVIADGRVVADLALKDAVATSDADLEGFYLQVTGTAGVR